jgi:hypothetical protein
MKRLFILSVLILFSLIVGCTNKAQDKINIIEISESSPVEGSSLTLITDGDLSATNFDVRLRDRLPLRKLSLSLLTQGETPLNQTSVTIYIPRGVYVTCDEKDKLDDGCMTTFQVYTQTKSSEKIRLNVLRDLENPSECLAGSNNCRLGEFCEDGLCYDCPADNLLCEDVLPDIIDPENPEIIPEETPEDDIINDGEEDINDDEDPINQIDPDCVEDQQCGENQICENGFCIDSNPEPDPCTEDLCPEGFSCDQDLNTCVSDEEDSPEDPENPENPEDPEDPEDPDDGNNGENTPPNNPDIPTIPSSDPCADGSCDVIWPICEDAFEGILPINQNCESGFLDEDGDCYSLNALMINIIGQIEDGLHPCEGENCTVDRVCERFPKFGRACLRPTDCLGDDIPVCYYHNENYREGQCIPKDFNQVIRDRLDN